MAMLKNIWLKIMSIKMLIIRHNDNKNKLLVSSFEYSFTGQEIFKLTFL